MFANDINNKGLTPKMYKQLIQLNVKRISQPIKHWADRHFPKKTYRDFPGGPVVKNPPHGARDTGLIPWPGQSLRASEQLSRRAAAPEAHALRARALRREEPL